jgi:hypothetical protein
VLGGFRKSATVLELDRKTPDRHTGRCELDHAIDPERGETDAVRHHARGDGDRGLDRHPRNREPLEPEGPRDQCGTIGIITVGALRSGPAAVANGYSLRIFTLKGFREGRIRPGVLVHKFSEAFCQRHASL